MEIAEVGLLWIMAISMSGLRAENLELHHVLLPWISPFLIFGLQIATNSNEPTALLCQID